MGVRDRQGTRQIGGYRNGTTGLVGSRCNTVEVFEDQRCDHAAARVSEFKFSRLLVEQFLSGDGRLQRDCEKIGETANPVAVRPDHAHAAAVGVELDAYLRINMAENGNTTAADIDCSMTGDWTC